MLIFKRHKKGFSIMEVVVAVFIITVGLVSMLTLVLQNVKVNRVNRHAVVAANLAQEGLELVRKIRDENLWNGLEWDNAMIIGSSTIDYKHIIIAVPNIESTSTILKLNADGFYQYINNSLIADSPYSRMITIVKQSDEVAVISCQVRYWAGFMKYDYIATEYLTNWHL